MTTCTGVRLSEWEINAESFLHSVLKKKPFELLQGGLPKEVCGLPMPVFSGGSGK
jgi:hypothetical protein